jgi:diadenosine tetraphosphate (Ap4A) HIT family hydrolase
MVKLWTRKEWHEKTNWQIVWKENCIFCKAKKEQPEYILWKWKYWYIIINKYPYSWNEEHIMAVPCRHVLYSTDFNSEELLELVEVHKFVKRFFWEESYFSCTRETQEYRSIEHYHTHFIPWRLQGKFLRKMLEWQGFPIKEDMKLDA